jgi:hypothetical protein
MLRIFTGIGDLMHRIAMSVAGIAAVAALSACTPSGTVKSDTKSSLPGPVSTYSEPSKAAYTPVPSDFVVGVIEMERKCFGSAGCSVTYTINPQYVGSGDLPDKTTVIYKVLGGEDPQTGNFTIDQDGTATFDREARISTDQNSTLTAQVVQVIPGR